MRTPLTFSWTAKYLIHIAALFVGFVLAYELRRALPIHWWFVDPDAVRVELYAQSILDDAPVRQEMQRMHRLVAAATGYAYVGRVPDERPASDYTARLIPRHDNALVPLEAPQILWQR